MPNNTSPFIPNKLLRVRMSKARANFHPLLWCTAPSKSNIIYPFFRTYILIIFHSCLSLSDPHPIQQRLLPTCFKCTLNPTTSHILQHWHLSLCCAHTSHRPGTPTGVPATPLLSSPITEAESNPLETPAKHVPPCPQSSKGFPWPNSIQSPHHGPPGLQGLSSGHSLSALASHHSCSWHVGLHWPPCPSLKISRPQPLLLHFLACYFPKYWYLQGLRYHFNLVSKQTSFLQRGFSWLSLVNSPPSPISTTFYFALSFPP